MSVDWIKKELEHLSRASERGRLRTATEPRARTARYDRKNNRIVVELTNGCVFAFPPKTAQGLSEATPAQLAKVEVLGKGLGLHWEVLDADLSVPGLLAGILGSKAWMREMGKRGGAARSQAKIAAARANGAKGGRPASRAA